ncbi:MAG: right-handed parallel beta-helix repeat-containing protein [Bacteroidales bacterium]|nr:right-handed parallel beta-helix repeat-containing protein [Bacteroidales bacterium]
MKKSLLLFAVLTLSVLVGFAQTIAFEEDFESGSYVVTSSGSTTWDINSRIQAGGLYSDSCVVAFASSSYLTTNQIVTTGNSSVILEFKHICKIEPIFDGGQIEYSLDGGITWVALTSTEYLGAGSFTSNKFTAQSYAGDWQASTHTALPQNTWWKTEQFDLSALAGNQADLRIRFKLTDGNNNGPNQNAGWYIDDIKVTIAPSELTPPSITQVSTIWTDTIYNTGPFTVNAKITDASGIDTAYVVYSTNGGSNDTLGMTVTAAPDTFSVDIPAQAYNTHVDYHIVAIDLSASANMATTPIDSFYIKQAPPIVIIGTGTSSSYSSPVNGLYNYSWSDIVYSNTEIATSGVIDSIFFEVATVTAPHTFDNQQIYLYTGDSLLSSTSLPDTTLMTKIFDGTYTFTATGWSKIALSTPYYYNGIDHLHVVWVNNDGSYYSGYPTFKYTSTTPSYKDVYAYSDVSLPTTGYLTYSRPNIKIAFQINNNVHDASVVSITEPLTSPIPTISTPYNVKTIIKNLGSDTLTNLTIHWEVNGVPQTPYSWVGSLLQDQSSTEITLGSVSFTNPGINNIRVYSTDPDGFADEQPLNDTVNKSYFVCPGILAGDYTIDPLSPTGGTNFQYFSEVQNALSYCGISDTTIFNIVPGTYNELLTFSTIPGGADTAWVIFQSSTGNATDVILTDSATSTGNNYIINLNGASFMAFKNLTFEPRSSSYARSIVINNSTNNILVDSNIFNGPVVSSTSSDLTHIYNYSSSKDTNLVIRNNKMYNNSYGLYMYGSSSVLLESGNVFENNLLENFYYFGIYSYYQDGFQIKNNTIKTNTTYGSPYGLGLYYNDKVVLSENEIYVPQYYGVYLYYCDGDATTQNEINNNFISIGGTTTSYAFYCNTSYYNNFYYNSINSYSTNTTSRALYLVGGTNHVLINNILSNLGAGYAIYSTTTSITSNYNDLYSQGTNLGYYNSANRVNLAAWQTATSQDGNSVSIYPNFFGMNDLHTITAPLNNLGSPIGITVDIDGDIRSLTNPDMGADEFTPPPYDAIITSVISPLGGCSLGVDSVNIKISNNGIDTINSGLTAFYTINGTGPVSQVVGTPIPPGDTIVFTFSTTVDLTAGSTDSVFNFEFYVNITGDPIQTNDSINYTIISLHSPQPVTVSNATTPYGTSTTLNATSSDTIQWYADALLTQLLHTGSSFTTPILYDTTIYYVASTSGVEYIYSFDTDLQGWIGSTPCPSYTTYNWAYDPDGGNGTAFMIDPSTTSSAVLISPPLPVFGDSVSLEFRHKFETESCCDKGYVAYRIDGGAWTHFTPTSGLYTGSAGLSVDPFASCAYGPTVGVFSGSSSGYMISTGKIPLNGATTLEVAFAFSSDGSIQGTGWYIDEVKISKEGCPGSISEDTVFITGFPSDDVGVIEIINPNSGIDLTNSEPISIRVVNWGSSDQNTIPVNLSINGTTIITDTITTTLHAGDSITFNFGAGADLSAYTTYNLAAYTTLSSDTTLVNDTAFKTVTNSMLIYCAANATSGSYEDLTGLGIGTTVYTNAATGAMYTDYTSLPPFIVAPNATYDISVMSDFAPGYSYQYSCWVNVFIDYNYDGDFDDVGELVYGASTLSSSTAFGTFTIPSNPHLGLTRVRVAFRESGTQLNTGPCGTWTWGEVEDYMVMIIPPIPNDAGVIAITAPDYIQSEGSSIPVEVDVKNFGTDTLHSIPIEYVANSGAPVPYTWNGTLVPGDTVSVTLPNVTVQVDANDICAYTVLTGDSNTFNDNTCGEFYGLPPVVLFEDDMENGTILSPASGTTYWQRGKPTASTINYAHSGDSVWTTMLTTNYANNIETYLEMPTMSFAGINDAYLSFYYWMDAEENSDGGFIQYSLNNGFTWLSLGGLGQTDCLNWYESYITGATPGWSTPTNGWQPAFIKLSSLNGMSNVKIRFGFKSNSTIVANGFALDDIEILALQVPVDAGVISIDQPTGATTPGDPINVNVTIQNFGSTTLTSIPVTYTINTGYPPQNGTWTGSLAPGATTTFAFTPTYNGPAQNYRLCAFTKVTGDPYPSNDSACLYIPMGQANVDAGISAILSPNTSTSSGQTVTVQARIKNFGLTTLTSIPVIYKINSITQANEVWTGTLNSGDSVDYTFTTTYQGPISQYNFCVKTNLVGDQVSSNDEICSSITSGIESASANGVVLLQNRPNPANDETEIRYTLPQPGTCKFTVRNALGEIIYDVETSGELGINKLVINTVNYEQGIYFYTIEYEDVILTRRFTILH